MMSVGNRRHLRGTDLEEANNRVKKRDGLPSRVSEASPESEEQLTSAPFALPLGRQEGLRVL